MKIFRNFNQICSLESAFNKDGRSLEPNDLSILTNASIVFDKDEILWVGPDSSLPQKYAQIESIDYTGHVLTPEIVDSHTHLVFAGNRSFEYSLRLNGADYEEIANAGGGILSTMEHTITASFDDLFNSAVARIERIYSYGVGTIEVKSGYGLTIESERKISKVIHKLKNHFSGRINILNTFLAAHAVPSSFKSSHDYLVKVVIPLLEELNNDKIIDFVDIFHEKNYFNMEDSRLLFEKAQELSLRVKIHADEFNDNDGAKLATQYNALSADHLLCTSDTGIEILSKSDTVATLLPGTAFFLGKPLAPAKKFLDANCKVALASDYNPGSCHCDNLLLIASICAKSMNFNIAQLWSAITLNASHALGIRDQGALVPGLKPRFSIFKCKSVDEITYSWGRNFSTNL